MLAHFKYAPIKMRGKKQVWWLEGCWQEQAIVRNWFRNCEGIIRVSCSDPDSTRSHFHTGNISQRRNTKKSSLSGKHLLVVSGCISFMCEYAAIWVITYLIKFIFSAYFQWILVGNHASYCSLYEEGVTSKLYSHMSLRLTSSNKCQKVQNVP